MQEKVRLKCDSDPMVFNRHSFGVGTALDDIERSIFDSEMNAIHKMWIYCQEIIEGFACEEPCLISHTLSWTMGKSKTDEDKFEGDPLYKTSTRVDWVLTIECKPQRGSGGATRSQSRRPV